MSTTPTILTRTLTTKCAVEEVIFQIEHKNISPIEPNCDKNVNIISLKQSVFPPNYKQKVILNLYLH